jgi:hypothetical protein
VVGSSRLPQRAGSTCASTDHGRSSVRHRRHHWDALELLLYRMECWLPVQKVPGESVLELMNPPSMASEAQSDEVSRRSAVCPPGLFAGSEADGLVEPPTTRFGGHDSTGPRAGGNFERAGGAGATWTPCPREDVMPR